MDLNQTATLSPNRSATQLPHEKKRAIMKLSTVGIILVLLAGYAPCAAAEKLARQQMAALVNPWPPSGWSLTPPGSPVPYPPYLDRGEFSSTIYRLVAEKLWSAQVNITDQQTHQQAVRLLSNFPHCETINFKTYAARQCGIMGETYGRRGLAYAVDRFLVEIAMIGPRPLELPEFQLILPQATTRDGDRPRSNR